METIKQKDVAMKEMTQELTRSQQAIATVEMKYTSEFKLETQIEEASNRVKRAVESRAIQIDAEEYEKARNQAEKNYQRELQLHAEDIKSVSEVKSAKQKLEENYRPCR